LFRFNDKISADLAVTRTKSLTLSTKQMETHKDELLYNPMADNPSGFVNEVEGLRVHPQSIPSLERKSQLKIVVVVIKNPISWKSFCLIKTMRKVAYV
jgi:hypothetical protein